MCAALLMVAACSAEKKSEKKAVTAKAQSAPYELLVVANKDWLKTGVGQAVMDAVGAPIEGLPQAEPSFRVTSINPQAFNGTFKMYSNIVFVEVGKKYRKAEMRVVRNEYCRPQLIVFLSAPDDASFSTLIQTRAPQLLSMFNEQEFARERGFLSKHYSGVVQTKARQMFGADIHVPADIDEIKTGKDFLWASASKQEFCLNVCLYVLPMRSWSLDQFVAARDSVMKVNIPGGREDQWMETDIRTVTSSYVKVPQSDAASVMTYRGLWDMRHDAMGGPFVSYLYPDDSNNRVLVAEGFVFAPEEKKRPLVRQLEAALQLLTFK